MNINETLAALFAKQHEDENEATLPKLLSTLETLAHYACEACYESAKEEDGETFTIEAWTYILWYFAHEAKEMEKLERRCRQNDTRAVELLSGIKNGEREFTCPNCKATK